MIEEKVLSSAQSSVTFSSIPGTYKDLVLELVGSSSAIAILAFQVNGDTASNYSATVVDGDGATPYSNRYTSATYIRTTYGGGVTTNFTAFAHFMSYANTSVNKTVLARYSTPSLGVGAAVGLWRSTSAITSVTAFPVGTTFASGLTARLWGVSG